MSALKELAQVLHQSLKTSVALYALDEGLYYQTSSGDQQKLAAEAAREFPQAAGVLRTLPAGELYHHLTQIGLEYLFAAVPDTSDILIVGPFFSGFYGYEQLTALLHKNPEVNQGHQYLQTLPAYNQQDLEAIGQLVANLLRAPWQKTALYRPPVHHREDSHYPALTADNDLILQRYRIQDATMHAISCGDLTQVTQLEEAMLEPLAAFAQRVPGQPLRSSKNLTFVLNTMCRVAAEDGGVSAVQLHQVSEKYALLIEKVANMQELRQLAQQLPREYCLLVKNCRFPDASPLIRQVAAYLQQHYHEPLTLTTIADKHHVNTSYLSQRFKAETGQTLFQYLNHCRITQAKWLLRHDRQRITDIAYQVGYNDPDYFSRSFQKVTGETPSQYRKRRRT